MKIKYLIAFVIILFGVDVCAQQINRVEPPCWWVKMGTKLQLMIYGSDLSGSSVSLAENVKGLSVSKVYNADSKNYIFADVKIGWGVPAGDYKFVVTAPSGKKIEFIYTLHQRKENSRKRMGFSTADMVYLLMPDRFANGDSSNDSVEEAFEKADRNNHGGRHGGDIKGMADNLGYLESLGVTAIWSTPLLFDNEPISSYHGYACADYYRIDPRLGTNELYREYVCKAHQKDIKIIMDMVPNHCGTAHWWMKDLPFKDWINTFDEYTVSNHAIATQSDPYADMTDIKLCTKGWFDTSMPDMNLKQTFLLNYLTQWAVWWVEYADIDGIRVDTYPYSDKEAISKWTKNILQEYPELNIVGECWYSNPLAVSYWEGARKQYDGYCSHLPSVMDFPLREAVINGFTEDQSVPEWGKGVVRIYNSLTLDFVYKNPYNLLIFASNHDTNRLAHDMGKDFAKIKMIMTLIATMRGIPQIYYGDELGFTSEDGSTGHVQERVDFPGGWVGDEKNMFIPKDRSAEQQDLFQHTATLFNWRKGSKAVHKGLMRHFHPTRSNIYVYFRYTDKECVMTIINNGRSDYIVEWEHFKEITSKFATKGKNILTQEKVRVGEKMIVRAQSSAVVEF